VLRFMAVCGAPVTTLAVNYRLFFDLDPQHRGLFRLDHEGATRVGIFSADAPDQAFTLAELSDWDAARDYGIAGIWHIWTGFDHILFLLSLLLPAVLIPSGTAWNWKPAASFSSALVEVGKIVTAFTLAHSTTLSLAALGYASLPSRLVESAIAASVILAALNNVWPVVQGKRWLIAFGFGLIHGFGFASVLADLGLPRHALAVALIAFNLGVEAGQMAIVGVFLPAAFAVHATGAYRRVLIVYGSCAIALIALVWLIERALNMQVFAA